MAAFIGASIGANLALQYIVNPPAGGPEFKTAVLNSAGLNYSGIKTEPMVKNLSAEGGSASGGKNQPELGNLIIEFLK